MRVAPGLHLVFSGGGGFDLTDQYDCNAWLLDAGDGFALFDAGAGRDPEAAVRAIAAEGVDPRSVRWLLLTHGHADHSGGARTLRDRLGCAVFAGDATARMVEAGDRAGISLDAAIARGVYPGDYAFAACPVERRLQPGEQLRLGRLGIQVVASPGHSHDHVCFLVTDEAHRTLIVGDALFAGGRVALQDIWDCSVPDSCATVRTLAGLAIDRFLPGHGVFSLQRGDRHARQALERVDRLLVPDPFP